MISAESDQPRPQLSSTELDQGNQMFYQQTLQLFGGQVQPD